MKRAFLLILVFLAACGPQKMDDETIAYAKSIEFRNVRLSAKESYSRQTVYFLRIDVHNNGQRVVGELDVVLFFYDAQGKVVTTERATAVSSRLKPLGPGETRDFQHGFDLPADWNRVSPNVGIAYMELK
jgi:hypothetical protein